MMGPIQVTVVWDAPQEGLALIPGNSTDMQSPTTNNHSVFRPMDGHSWERMLQINVNGEALKTTQGRK